MYNSSTLIDIISFNMMYVLRGHALKCPNDKVVEGTGVTKDCFIKKSCFIILHFVWAYTVGHSL